MLEIGDNVKFSIRLEPPQSHGQKIEVQFPALYCCFEGPDWYWWVTELDMVAGKTGEHYYAFYTHCTLGKLLSHQSSPSDFVFLFFDKEGEVWTEDPNV